MHFAVERRSGGFRALLFASNGRLIWWTEIYDSKAGAQNAIRIAQESYAAPIYDRT